VRQFNVLLMSVSAVAVGAPAWAEDDVEAVSVAAASVAGEDIVVLGKSYGQEVGKTLTPLKDVPNTVTVIDREQIELQNLFTLEDALTATPGVTVTGVGSEDPSFMSRGFAINNYLVDGVPTLSFGFPAVVPDLFFYDRLEVLRGPAGLFSGSGNPAGSINLVRKRPLDETRLQGAVGYGSYDNVRGEVDASLRLGSSAGLRVGAMIQDQDQFFDIAHRNRLAAFAVASVDLGPNTRLTFGGNYDRYKPAIQSGLPGIIGGVDGSEGELLDIDRSTYLGADWNRFRSDSWSGFVEIAHQLGDTWTLRATGLVTDIDRIDVYSYIGSQPVTPASGLTNHIAFRGDSFMTTKAVDVNAVGSFSALGRDHTLIVGADYQSSSYQSYFTRLSNYARIDVYNPVSPVEPPLDPYGPLPYYPVQGSNAACPNTTTPVTPPPPNCILQNYGATDTQVDQTGIYGQLRLSPLEGLTLVGGGRLTWWETENTTLLPQRLEPTGYSVEGQFTPYAGIVFDVTDDFNIYASYADSFTPQAAPAGRGLPEGGQIEPLSGSQYEAGAKLALMNDRLLLTLAGYEISQTNRLYNDPEDPTLVYQIGKVRVRGIETEAAGEIVPGWRVNAGYSYTKSKYLEDANPVLEGLSIAPVIPEHSIKLFTNYAPTEGPLAGASVGGGVTWFSSTFAGNPAVFRPDGSLQTRSTIVRQGSYAVVDLRAGYELSDRVSVSLNVSNLLDKTYYARIAGTGRGNYYGSPRTVFASLRFAYP
jgi:outer membrane receptor for ferric coprogen and ferric-rhodotorulic acid